MLFNRKDRGGANQTSDIKEAAAPPINNNSTPEPEHHDDFVNPFAQSTPPQSSPSQPSSFETQPTSNPFDNPQPNSPDPFSSASNATNQSMGQPTQSPSFNQPQQTSNPFSGGVDEARIQEMIDETVEKVLEEAWGEITNKVNKVVSWKDKVEQQVNMLKEDIVAIRDGFETLEKKLFSKLSNYDKNILDVNSEMKALEKVFSKITPTLVNNVNELSKIAEDLREETKNKKSMRNG